ncbi:hypothetical protein HPB52_013569 [Rhipicephalus sanguineus]|uniref:Reverse transcriptase domain-containing protein n=1 Tax=Rhipicephalus sanguineus TaxID=34632 RepID=A0A9D4T5M9_RHISA|nr:hypothetical protein HPB52_013569 [Rhipicephalus sanguineus]
MLCRSSTTGCVRHSRGQYICPPGIPWNPASLLPLARCLERQVLSAAVHLEIRVGVLAELRVDQLANRTPVAQAPPLSAAVRSISVTCHHADSVAGQIQALYNEPIHMHEVKAALEHMRRRRAPQAEGITSQILCNLADAEQERLVECFNIIWGTIALPESWLVAVVSAVFKPWKPVISRLHTGRCPSPLRPYFAEQQTGFRRHRCTADSIFNVVATLEDAKVARDVAMLAFLDQLGMNGRLSVFISAFLTGRTIRGRVGQELSEPRNIAIGVPQGSVMSPYLFNVAVAGLPA